MGGDPAAGRLAGGAAHRVSPTLPALLDDVAARHGPREAIVAARRRMTYAELAAESVAIARGLVARGIGKGSRVGLLLPNSPEWIAIAFAVWRCSAQLVPLSTLDRARELGHALRHADVTRLVASRGFLRHDYVATLDEIAPGISTAEAPLRDARLPALREIVWLEDSFDLGTLTSAGAGLDAAWPGALSALVDPEDPATIFFTSGTTAAPKGVVHVHRALCRAAVDIGTVLGLAAEDRTWGYLPFFFTGGLIAVALATIASGGAVAVQDVFEPGETLRLLEAERCTVFFAWPHQAAALVAHPRFGTTRLHLRKGVGANTSWAAAFYPSDHHAVGTYGMTETGPLCTAWPWDAPLALRASSHGPPVGGKEIRIVDAETSVPLAAGSDGEICVRGPTLLSHYHRHEPADPFDADGFFHTGDLGRLDDRGALHFLGRLKDVIKTAGVNVAAAEVEAVLLDHPAVAAAHVVGVPDATRGENVAAFVVPSTPVAADELLAHCRTRLAAFKVPRHLWLRREGDLPLKASGKVDKTRLRAEGASLIRSADAPGGPRRPPPA